MAPLIVVAIVAGSLFTSGVAVKPLNHNLGTVLEVSGLGVGIGGAVGGIAGVGTALGITSAAAITGGAVVGGVGLPVINYKLNH